MLLVIGFSQIGEDYAVSPKSALKGVNSFMNEQDDSWDFGFIESQKSDFTVLMSHLEYAFYGDEINSGKR